MPHCRRVKDENDELGKIEALSLVEKSRFDCPGLSDTSYCAKCTSMLPGCPYLFVLGL
jgi:hypothetical protein